MGIQSWQECQYCQFCKLAKNASSNQRWGKLTASTGNNRRNWTNFASKHSSLIFHISVLKIRCNVIFVIDKNSTRIKVQLVHTGFKRMDWQGVQVEEPLRIKINTIFHSYRFSQFTTLAEMALLYSKDLTTAKKVTGGGSSTWCNKLLLV